MKFCFEKKSKNALSFIHYYCWCFCCHEIKEKQYFLLLCMAQRWRRIDWYTDRQTDRHTWTRWSVHSSKTHPKRGEGVSLVGSLASRWVGCWVVVVGEEELKQVKMVVVVEGSKVWSKRRREGKEKEEEVEEWGEGEEEENVLCGCHSLSSKPETTTCQL